MTVVEAKFDSVFRDVEVLVSDGAGGVRMFGPGFELTGCEVHIRSAPGGIGFVHSIIRDSVVHADKRVKQVDFTGVAFFNCKFEGHFEECDFGHRTMGQDYGGSLAGCDFGSAVLDNCRVFDSDLGDSRFAETWPHIALRGNYAKIAAEHISKAKSIDEKVFLKVLSESPPGEVAQFAYAPSLAKELHMTEPQLRAFLLSLPFAKRDG